MYRPPMPTIDEYAVSLGPPVLSFTQAEELEGKKLLDRMGIPDGAWFVCFQSRDSAYYHHILPKFDNSQTDHRNCSISNYFDAMKYVASRGGYALRVGAVVAEAMPNLGDPHIIDYASDYRTDFGDLYLLAKCKFFVGCNSGLTTVPMMFNVPVVDANSLIMPTRGPGEAAYALPLNSRDLFLPRPIYSLAESRQLTLREILQDEVRYFADLHEYAAAGLQVWESTAEDILGGTREMNERLDGGFTYTDQDHDLQSRFRSYIDPKPKNLDAFARVGAEFLRSHEDLIG